MEKRERDSEVMISKVMRGIATGGMWQNEVETL